MTKKTMKEHYERVACVFQGGGSLGAFQVGAFQAITEYLSQHKMNCNFFAGLSIGAINAAIIVGNPPKKQLPRLLEFWNTICPKKLPLSPFSFTTFEMGHQPYEGFGEMNSILFGLPGFFKPRAFPHNLAKNSLDQLSYYDLSPLRETLERLIDFKRINSKEHTLYLGAVDVQTGEMELFDNQEIEITPDHIMASCALPPGFPAVKIGEKYYWDGGMFCNSLLTHVLEAEPKQNTLLFMVDCFGLKGNLPENIIEVGKRKKDILYGSRSRWLNDFYSDKQMLQKKSEEAIRYLASKLSPQMKSDPKVQEILQRVDPIHISVVHIIFNHNAHTHTFKDFTPRILQNRIDLGYSDTLDILKKPDWEKAIHKKDKDYITFYSVYDDDEEDF